MIQFYFFIFMKNILKTFWTIANNEIRILTSAKDFKTSRVLLNRNNNMLRVIINGDKSVKQKCTIILVYFY